MKSVSQNFFPSPPSQSKELESFNNTVAENNHDWSKIYRPLRSKTFCSSMS